MVKISSKFPIPLILDARKNIYVVVPIFVQLIDDQFFAINRSTIFFLVIFNSIDFLLESIIDQIRSIIFQRLGPLRYLCATNSIWLLLTNTGWSI